MTQELDRIFDKHRLPSYIDCIPLFFYFPLGIFLATVRFFIGIQAFLLSIIFLKLPKLRCFLLRIMCAVLGFVVFTEHSETYDKNIKVIISNHITNFDHLALNLITPAVVPSVWNLPEYLTWLLGYTDFGASQGRQVLIKRVHDFIKKSRMPVLIFPEGATTNGKVGLLKFNTWPFLLGYAVQPVALAVTRPHFIRIAPSVLGSRWWSDMFWFLFVPYTIFTIRFLPVEEKSEDGDSSFCLRVQNCIAKELDLQETNFTSSDKVEYAKCMLQIRKLS